MLMVFEAPLGRIQLDSTNVLSPVHSTSSGPKHNRTHPYHAPSPLFIQPLSNTNSSSTPTPPFLSQPEHKDSLMIWFLGETVSAQCGEVTLLAYELPLPWLERLLQTLWL